MFEGLEWKTLTRQYIDLVIFGDLSVPPAEAEPHVAAGAVDDKDAADEKMDGK